MRCKYQLAKFNLTPLNSLRSQEPRSTPPSRSLAPPHLRSIPRPRRELHLQDMQNTLRLMPCKWETRNLGHLQPGKGCACKLTAPFSKFEDKGVEIQMGSTRAPVAMEVLKGAHNYTLSQGQRNRVGADSQEFKESKIWEVQALVTMTWCTMCWTKSMPAAQRACGCNDWVCIWCPHCRLRPPICPSLTRATPSQHWSRHLQLPRPPPLSQLQTSP